MQEYRAAYYVSADGQASTVLTLPEEANLSDAELRERAIEAAKRADIVYEGEHVSLEDGEPRIHMDDLVQQLNIGTWWG